MITVSHRYTRDTFGNNQLIAVSHTVLSQIGVDGQWNGNALG
jgi:hypothetical protein